MKQLPHSAESGSNPCDEQLTLCLFCRLLSLDGRAWAPKTSRVRVLRISWEMYIWLTRVKRTRLSKLGSEVSEVERYVGIQMVADEIVKILQMATYNKDGFTCA